MAKPLSKLSFSAISAVSALYVGARYAVCLSFELASRSLSIERQKPLPLEIMEISAENTRIAVVAGTGVRLDWSLSSSCS
jgi:hypothetical protein